MASSEILLSGECVTKMMPASFFEAVKEALDKMDERRRVYFAAAVNFYCIDPKNCGDMASSPFVYFESSSAVEKMHIQFLNKETIGWFKKKKVILGGSGLFLFQAILTALLQAKPAVLIGWGIGVNRHFDGVGGELLSPQRFDLLGVRDWGLGPEWVPCVSCWSPLFDQYRRVPITEDIVIYDHARYPLDIPHFKRLSNAASMPQVIKHLASAETVLTSSYHGVYWATLLGKKVVMFPFSTKFNHLKYPVPQASSHEWRDKLVQAQAYPEALEECRAKNMSFSNRVSERLGIKLELKK